MPGGIGMFGGGIPGGPFPCGGPKFISKGGRPNGMGGLGGPLIPGGGGPLMPGGGGPRIPGGGGPRMPCGGPGPPRNLGGGGPLWNGGGPGGL